MEDLGDVEKLLNWVKFKPGGPSRRHLSLFASPFASKSNPTTKSLTFQLVLGLLLALSYPHFLQLSAEASTMSR